MRLLICTQAVDARDPVLGFMHRWIEEFSSRYERITVVCLRAGDHHLPSNVEVIPLGEKRRFLRALEVCSIAFARRKEYDGVFVHMNQEYVLAVGWLWRILRKRIVLWRNHKKGSWLTRVAGRMSHAVCYTSPAAFVARFRNAVQMPIGIDTSFFKLLRNSSGEGTILFLGRLDAVKHPDIFLEALGLLAKEGVTFRADIYGDPTPGREAYAEELRQRFSTAKGVTFHQSVHNNETPALYSSHAIYVNLTPSGSFDKTIGEAMASGCIVVAANDVLRDVLPKELMVDSDDSAAVARGIRAALTMGEGERVELAERSRAYVEQEHALALLAKKLLSLFETRAFPSQNGTL